MFRIMLYMFSSDLLNLSGDSSNMLTISVLEFFMFFFLIILVLSIRRISNLLFSFAFRWMAATLLDFYINVFAISVKYLLWL
jgi:hypothetical protein